MKRAALIAVLLLIAGCGRDNDEANEAQTRRRMAQPPLPELEPPGAVEEEREDAGDAADVLRHYYVAIEAGDYEAAWKLRSDPADDVEGRKRFADNFKAYERYRATVGPPSRPVEANGWAYVEVPVMITGAFRGGKSFGSSGSVTLRKATSGADQAWRVYTADRSRR
jgi:hypothetical protein